MRRSRKWAVLKFGGTSVSSATCWATIRDAVRDVKNDGLRPLVVCSAVAGVSNALEEIAEGVGEADDPPDRLRELARIHTELAHDLDIRADDLVSAAMSRLARLTRSRDSGGAIPPSVRAEILSTGELLATRIFARWMSANGVETEWRDARRLLCSEPPPEGACQQQAYLSAVCSSDTDEVLREELEAAEAPVVLTQGFIARDGEGRTVLLGRGGSDVAAALLAAKLEAERLEIWTDVPGVFTANPHLLENARLISRLSYNEAECHAGFGAKVLHPRCIEPVRNAGIPLRIRWTRAPGIPGTRITEDGGDEGGGVKAVVARGDMCLVTMNRPEEWQPVGFMADVATCFREHAICMDLLSSSPSRIQATVDLAAAVGTRERLPDLMNDLEKVCEPTLRHDVATVTLVGRGIRNTIYEFGPKLRILEKKDLLMVSPTANDLSISFVVPARQKDGMVKRLHRVLFEQIELDDHFGPRWSELDAGVGRPQPAGTAAE